MSAKKQIRRARKNAKPIDLMMSVAKSLPAPKKRQTTAIRGLYSKLRFMETFKQIFETNESLPPEKKLTDDQIKALILKEFAHKPGLKKNFTDRYYTVNYYRSLYNKGVMTDGQFPTFVSFRYNDNGTIVDPRTGKRVLTPMERKEYIKRWSAKNQHYQQEQERKANARRNQPKPTE